MNFWKGVVQFYLRSKCSSCVKMECSWYKRKGGSVEERKGNYRLNYCSSLLYHLHRLLAIDRIEYRNVFLLVSSYYVEQVQSTTENRIPDASSSVLSSLSVGLASGSSSYN